ncbi:hypothetical protein OAO87_01480 [bacterium]|nr:hypothetical protein [bacterium]
MNPEPSPREYLRKARTLLRIRREEALKYPCEKRPPVLNNHVERDVVFGLWEKTQPPRSGDVSAEDHLKRLKAEFRQVSMADKVQLYEQYRVQFKR